MKIKYKNIGLSFLVLVLTTFLLYNPFSYLQNDKEIRQQIKNTRVYSTRNLLAINKNAHNPYVNNKLGLNYENITNILYTYAHNNFPYKDDTTHQSDQRHKSTVCAAWYYTEEEQRLHQQYTDAIIKNQRGDHVNCSSENVVIFDIDSYGNGMGHILTHFLGMFGHAMFHKKPMVWRNILWEWKPDSQHSVYAKQCKQLRHDYQIIPFKNWGLAANDEQI
jgi:hypothetical protein